MKRTHLIVIAFGILQKILEEKKASEIEVQNILV